MDVGDPTTYGYSGAAPVADEIDLFDVSMTAGSNVVNSASAGWTAASVGKAIAVQGAGSGTIAVWYSTTQVGVSFTNTGASISGAVANWGTDNQAAFNAAFAYAQQHGGEMVWLPPGKFLTSSLNATYLVGMRVEGAGGANNQLLGPVGTVLVPLDPNAAAFEMTACVGTRLAFVQIGHHWTAITGKAGIVVMPAVGPGPAFQYLADGGLQFDHVAVDGNWTYGSFYGFGLTTAQFYNCSLTNRLNNRVGVTFTADNCYGYDPVTRPGGIQSLFVSSIPGYAGATVATGLQGTGDIDFYSSGMSTGTAGTSTPTLHLRSTGRFAMYNTKVNNSGFACVYMIMAPGGSNIPSMHLESCQLYPEYGTPPSYSMYLDASNGWPRDGAGNLIPSTVWADLQTGFSGTVKGGGAPLQFVGNYTGTL